MVPARPSPEDSLTRFAKLAIAAAAATFILISVGGLVRATDSGLGCPDWPLCFGDWVPPAELHAWIEHSHRLVAAVLVGPLVGAVALITVFNGRRRDRALLIAAVGAGVLVIVQALLGGQVVIQQLRRELVTAHLGMALTVLALTILIADRAVHGPMPRRRSALPVRLIGLTTVAVFAQMLLGSWVTGHEAGLAYPDFPLMNGSILPAVDAQTQAIQVAHRALALAVATLVIWTAVLVRRHTQSRLPRTLAAVAVGLVIVQVALGAANVWSRLSALFVVPHLTVGAALFATCCWLLLSAMREPAVAHVPAGTAAPGGGGTLRAYVALTKPRIIELLLVTTIPPMVLAQRGIPSLWLMARGHHRRISDGRRRERHQHVPRPRHRRPDAPHASAAIAAPRGGAAQTRSSSACALERRSRSLAGADGQPAVSAAGAPAPSASTSSSTRSGSSAARRRTSSSVARPARPAAGRLGGGHRHDRAAGPGAVRHRLLLDAAALLGAGARSRATTRRPACR